MIKKKGVSPVIATVLLISIVIILGLIVFLWFKSIAQETITKFDKNVELVCDDVSFDASYSAGVLYLANTGSVPIYNMKLKLEKDRGHETKDLMKLSTAWENRKGITQGTTFTASLATEFSGFKKAQLIPVLIGKSDKGERAFVCQDRHAEEVTLG
jgi:flagellin-like protein